MSDLRVAYSSAEVLVDMMRWLAQHDPEELFDLACNLAADLEVLKSERAAAERRGMERAIQALRGLLEKAQAEVTPLGPRDLLHASRMGRITALGNAIEALASPLENQNTEEGRDGE